MPAVTETRRLFITPAARAAVLLNAVSPATTARLMGAINRVLPTPTQLEGDEAQTGMAEHLVRGAIASDEARRSRERREQ